MAFTNYVPPLLTDAQAGALPNFIKNAIESYKAAKEAKYLGPKLEEELKKAQLYNQYYGPDIESQIGLRGAQSGLYGSQMRGSDIENQYLPEKYKAEIEAKKADARKADLLQSIRENLFNFNNSPGEGRGQSENNFPLYSGKGMPNAQNIENNQPIPKIQLQSSSVNYPQSLIAMQALGLGKPQIIEANGKHYAMTPFGAIDTGISGLSESEKYNQREDSKIIGELGKGILNVQQKSEVLDELDSELGSNAFEALRRNPILGSHELRWYSKFGSKEQQNTVGKITSLMNSFIKDSARDFPGGFRIGEQSLLRDMKPNPEDSLDVMKGKAEALTYLTRIAMQRSEIQYDLMRNHGLSLIEAKNKADSYIDKEDVKKEIHTILHPAGNNKKYTQDDLEYTAKKYGISVDDVKKRLGGK